MAKGAFDVPCAQWRKGAAGAECQRTLAAVRHAEGPVMTRCIGEALGLDTGVRGRLEPLAGS